MFFYAGMFPMFWMSANIFLSVADYFEAVEIIKSYKIRVYSCYTLFKQTEKIKLLIYITRKSRFFEYLFIRLTWIFIFWCSVELWPYVIVICKHGKRIWGKGNTCVKSSFSQKVVSWILSVHIYSFQTKQPFNYFKK